ncbi:taurine catabolism dioxygenase [Bradyrhizobium centrolobii]|uniref:Taurine catabolism dioxygenase n=1 Tax=Bradyrhizobium centrolobii TaxID=1505087 RepID=A0A176Z0Y4_9BRAD|nr:TauD/TfdA family dioxygenase [Bradyrhizobium centrolobii]OAF14081.1 taurine catabolism dioxygenase [Bradyrhizobium centrolobii]
MSIASSSGNVIPSADVIKCAARLSAEIRNVRLSGDLSEEVVDAIRQLLIEHRVLFFRGQRHFDGAEQERLAIRLGKLAQQSIAPTKGLSSGTDLDPGLEGRSAGQANVRYDQTVSVMRGAVMAPHGDAAWSNLAAAYLDLPLPLRRLADELWVVRSNAHDHALEARPIRAGTPPLDKSFAGMPCEGADPVVRFHPETGERLLVLGNFEQRFVGLQTYTGNKLFDLLESYITAPENTVRWSWTEDDIAIWDNRAAQHYPVRAHADQHQKVRRLVIDCELPVSDHDRRSVTRDTTSVRRRHRSGSENDRREGRLI